VWLTGNGNIKVLSYDPNNLEPAIGSKNTGGSSLRVRHRDLSSAPCVDQYITSSLSNGMGNGVFQTVRRCKDH
jgi:hypothetical protein